MLEWSRNVPILIITLARPELLETRPGWGAGKRSFLALDIQPLDETSMRDLLSGLVAGLPEAAIRSIVARAEGIPLYAVETVRMLVADGRLRPREEGGYEPAGDARRARRPVDAARAHRRPARRARYRRPGARPGRRGPRPVVHGGRPRRGRRRPRPRSWSRASRSSSGAT